MGDALASIYEGRPELTFDMVDRACRSYFLDDSRKE